MSNNNITMFHEWKPYQTELQKQIEELSLKCGISSSDDLKYSLMVPNGAFLNIPLDRSDEQIKQLKKCKRANNKKIKKCFVKSPNQEEQIVERQITPGYAYRRTPESVEVTLTDEFWANVPSNNYDKDENLEQKENMINYQEVVLNLEREIARLRIEIQEEKLARKETIENLRNEHAYILNKKDEKCQENIKVLEEIRREKLAEVKVDHNTYVEKLKGENAKEQAKLKDEINFLNIQLGKHKTFVEEKLERKWKDRQEELQHDMEGKTQELIDEQRMRLEKEKGIGIDQLTTLNNKHLAGIMETHQQEIEKLLRKFSDIARAEEKLKEACSEISSLKEENETLKTEISYSSEKLRKTENELTDVKVKLNGYEKGFMERIAEVEEKFSVKVESLTLENFELRKKYLRKCEELYEVVSKKEEKQNEKLVDAKELMQSVLSIRSRANTSLSLFEASNEEKPLKKFGSNWKESYRPRTAPLTDGQFDYAGSWKVNAESRVEIQTGDTPSEYSEQRQSRCRSAGFRLQGIKRQRQLQREQQQQRLQFQLNETYGQKNLLSNRSPSSIGSSQTCSSSSLEIPKVTFR